MPKQGTLTAEAYFSELQALTNTERIDGYTDAKGTLSSYIEDIVDSIWDRDIKDQLLEVDDAFRTVLRDYRDDEIEITDEQMDDAARKFENLQEVLVQKAAGSSTVYDMLVDACAKDQNISKNEARGVIDTYLDIVGRPLGVTFDFKLIHEGKSLAEEEKRKENDRKRQEVISSRSNPQPAPAENQPGPQLQNGPQAEPQPAPQGGAQAVAPQPAPQVIVPAPEPVPAPPKTYFDSDPAQVEDKTSFEGRVWELRHTKDYYQDGELEPREIPQNYAQKKEGLYLQYLIQSDENFASLNTHFAFGQLWKDFCMPEEVAYTMRRSNTVDYRMLSQRAHRLLADKIRQMEDQEKTIDSFDQDEYIIAFAKLSHELQRTASPSERSRSDFKKFVKATESLIGKAVDKDRVRNAVNEYRQLNPMPSNVRPVRRRDIRFTNAELKRHWGEWIGNPKPNMEATQGRQNLSVLHDAFFLMGTYYEAQGPQGAEKAQKAKELYEHMSSLFVDPASINNARLTRSFNAAAESLASLHGFFQTEMGRQMLADLPTAVSAKGRGNYSRLNQKLVTDAVDYIERTMKTGLNEELNHFSNMPAGALGLGLIDAYEDNEKPKSHLKAFITLLKDKKTAAPDTPRIEDLISTAEELDRSCEAAAKLSVQDQLDKMDEVQKKAGDFDTAFEEFKKANPGEQDLYRDFDKSWRGVKYHARASRYSDKSWDKYLEFHGKEFFDGREREYYAKALVAYQHKTEQPVPVFSRKRARKEAEILMKDPVYRYLIEKKPKMLKDLMITDRYGEASLLVTQPFRTSDMNKLKEAYAGLETMAKVVLEKPARNDPQKWKDFYQTLKEVVEGYGEGKSAEELAAGLNRVCQAASAFYKGRKSDRKVGSREAQQVERVMDTLSILAGVSELGKARVQAEFDRANQVRSKFYNRQRLVRMEEFGVRHAIERKAALELKDVEKRYQKKTKMQEIRKDLVMASEELDVDKLPEWNEQEDITVRPEGMVAPKNEDVRETIDVAEIKKSMDACINDGYLPMNIAHTFIKNCVGLCSTPAYKAPVDPKDPSKGFKAVVAKDSFENRTFTVAPTYNFSRNMADNIQKLKEAKDKGENPYKIVYDGIQELQKDVKKAGDENVNAQKNNEEKEMETIFNRYGVPVPKKDEINIHNEEAGKQI